MKLHELLQGIEVLEQNADPELELTGGREDEELLPDPGSGSDFWVPVTT